MRVWLPLTDRPGFLGDSEIVFARDATDGPGTATLESCPVGVGLGFDDVVAHARLVSIEDWPDGVDEEEGVPTVIGVRRRSGRRSLAFEVMAKEKHVDEIAEAIGQQCLDQGADGEGALPGLGLVCVPLEHSGSDASTWAWLKAQEAAVRSQLPGRAGRALTKGRARVRWYFTSVPEMGIEAIPGLRSSHMPVSGQGVEVAVHEANLLFERGSVREAMDVLEASAIRGNPLSLARLALECAATGEWGRLLAMMYWAELGQTWEECPEHLDDGEWEQARDGVRATASMLDAVARFVLDYPAVEAELLEEICGWTEDFPALQMSPIRLSQRAAEKGSVNGLCTWLWAMLKAGDPSSAIEAFERFDRPVASLSSRLKDISPADDDAKQVRSALKERGAWHDGKGARVWAEVQANAGLAHALQGSDDKALALWADAAGSSEEARVGPAVLLAFKGDVVAGRALARDAITAQEWEPILAGMAGDCSPVFTKWREAAQAVSRDD